MKDAWLTFKASVDRYVLQSSAVPFDLKRARLNDFPAYGAGKTFLGGRDRQILVYPAVDQGSLNYPFWGDQTMQIYRNFDGFPFL